MPLKNWKSEKLDFVIYWETHINQRTRVVILIYIRMNCLDQRWWSIIYLLDNLWLMCIEILFTKFSVFEYSGRTFQLYSCRSEICTIGVSYLWQFEQESGISILVIIFPFKRKRVDRITVAGLQTRLMKYTSF